MVMMDKAVTARFNTLPTRWERAAVIFADFATSILLFSTHSTNIELYATLAAPEVSCDHKKSLPTKRPDHSPRTSDAGRGCSIRSSEIKLT